jgi:ubiquinone/menaquinone biosynthesis C-methylase UbiE
MSKYFDDYWKIDEKDLEFFAEPIRGLGKNNKYLVEKILRYINDGKYLEVGCGTGTLLNLLKEHNEKLDIIGIDISEWILNIAKQKYPDISVQLASVTDLPFENEKFDCIIVNGVIEYVQDTEKQFEELYRVLKPGGYLIIVTMGWNIFKFILELILGSLHLMTDSPINPVEKRVRFYTKKSLTNILNNYKFKIVEFEKLNLLLGIPRTFFCVAIK